MEFYFQIHYSSLLNTQKCCGVIDQWIGPNVSTQHTMLILIYFTFKW